MDFWWRITGYARVRMTSPQPERLLGRLSGHMQLRDISRPGALTVECKIRGNCCGVCRTITEQTGGTFEILGYYGAPGYWKRAMRLPVLTGFLTCLVLLSMVLPNRILFIRIQGNELVPRQQIRTAAEEAGLRFGASRREIRSEQIKNRLLSALPDLAWVGVNTNGCVATISVEERRPSPPEDTGLPNHMVASSDAVISDFTVTSGNALCRQGQAVRKGEVLISGYLDLGDRTRIEPAQGEVYGLTQREIRGVLPVDTVRIKANGGSMKKYSFLIGKKRINLHRDGGILYPTCGKMTEVKPLTLPGGWELPVCLVIDRYVTYDMAPVQREQTSAVKVLREYMVEQLRREMIAGEIRGEQTALSQEKGRYCLNGRFSCREMIGRYSEEVLIEGDAKDDGKID